MFPWLLSTLGGVLIGLAAVLLMGSLGRIAGISGIVGGLASTPSVSDPGWRLAFLIGLILPSFALSVLSGGSGIGQPTVSWPWMAAAGLLVGIGTRLGSGCTSGHGVCGIARLSPRSIVATLVFMLSGMVTVFVTHHLFGTAHP
ncbi:YeeE/YedE family protein [Dyella psychrodurans]|uniref:YeeE/YedE family protein n=1 Tax=Dyella psychrodurans TaxID=1927960 RepID=A0A370XE67_9GAMM|nr:YeeE/YedE family protein [Dyella psychrodurans]RDS86714.1 YeeE/YedE family protein [Dyella psychrodurans]